MRVLVTTSNRCILAPDGILWTANPSTGYRFWTRYLDVYDEVHVLVRAKVDIKPPTTWNQVSGAGIKIHPLPYYVGPWEFAKSYHSIRHSITETLKQVEAIQLRLPCAIGGEVYRLLPPGRPYGIEVISDPYDTFSPGSVKHPLRPLFRWWFTRTLRQQCAQACASAYVTEHALQRRYPPANNTFTTHFSSINLANEAIANKPRQYRNETTPFHLIFVGTLEQYYKAPDILIGAVALCIQQGVALTLTLIGDGQYRSDLERLAADLGIRESVHFLGYISAGSVIRDHLDHADLFVLPSRQEGVPRAMIEAMARALPCIGSTVGGIPELIPPEDIVAPDNVTGLANKIREVVSDPTRMMQMSVRNLNKAKEYSDEVLRQRRIALYQYVQTQTEQWLKSHPAPELVIPI